MGKKRGGIDDGDMGAEHTVGLRDLEADGATAEHDQVLDPLVHVEDRLIGEIAHLVEAGDRRDHRRGASGHDEAPGADEIVTGFDRGLVKEARLLLEDADAEEASTGGASPAAYGQESSGGGQLRTASVVVQRGERRAHGEDVDDVTNAPVAAWQPGDLTPMATEDDDESEDAWQLTDRRDER